MSALPGRTSPSAGDGVLSTTLRGTGWTMGSALASRGLSFLVTLVVARAFGPAEFGLIAVCWIVHNAAVLLRDQAVTSTIVIANDSPVLHNTVFMLNAVLSLVLALGVVALGAPVSSMVGLEAGPLLALFGAAFFTSSLGSVPSGLLQRSLRFRAMAVTEFSSVVVYVGATLVLLALGVGPEAVGWGQLAGAAFGSLAVWVAARFHPSRELSLRAFRKVAQYSILTAAITALGFVFANVDTMWVAMRGTATELGLYTLAFNLAFVFALTLAQVIQKVAFSTHASFEREGRSGRRLLLESERLILLVSLPVAWALVLYGPELLDRLFGVRYSGSATPLRILAIYGVLAAVGASAMSYLRAQSHLRVVVGSLSVQVMVALVALPFAMTGGGIAGVAWAVTGALAVGTTIILVAAFRLAGVGAREATGVLPGPLAAAGLVVPLVCLAAMGETAATYWVGLAGLVVYLAASIHREVRVEVSARSRFTAPPILWRGLVAALACAGAIAVGVVAAVAPPLAIVAAIICALAWIASAQMRQATLVAIALVPVLPIGLFVDLGPRLPLVTAARGVVATLVLAAVLALVRGRLRVRRWPVWGALALWLVAVALSVPGSIDVSASRLRLISELIETAAFVGIVYCVFDRSTYRQALRALTVGAAAGALLALLQVVGFDVMAGLRERAAAVTDRGNPLTDTGDVRLGILRAQGAFQTPSFMGATMAMGLPVAYALMLTDSKRWRRWWQLCTALIVGGLIVSVTRAAWLVAAAAMVWVVGAALRRGHPVVRHLYWVASAAVAGAWLLPSTTRRVADLVSGILDTHTDLSTSTTSYRLFLTENVLAASRERPWTGFGAGTFDRIGIVGINQGLVVQLKSPDSHLLRLLAEVGRVGVLAFAVLLATVLVSMWRTRRAAATDDQLILTAVVASAIGFILVNLTVSAFTIAQPMFFFWAMVAAASACAAPSVGEAGEVAVPEEVVTDADLEHLLRA